jgi:hypothetical protein
MVNIKKMVQPHVKYTNAIGYSNKLMPKEKDGKLDYNQEVIRIYVPKKIKLKNLPDRMVLPMAIDDIPIDVFEIGYPVAGGPIPRAKSDNRRNVVRPLVSGISVGNYAISAGTLGEPATKDGEIYDMSNAHVLCDDPSKDWSNETRIVQPGKHDGGNVPYHIVGHYHWHEKIYPEHNNPSGCNVAKTYVNVGNFFSNLFGRRSRFNTVVFDKNHADQAAYKRVDGIDFDITRTFDFDISDYDLVSRVFAGSNVASIHCKTKYQVNAGYIPVVPYKNEPVEGFPLRKSGRTTMDTENNIIDNNGSIRVNYGNFTAFFDDIVLTLKMVEGGDSGSDSWQKIE